MKKLILLTFNFLFLTMAVMAQVKIGNNPTTINPSSLLELESTTQGFLIPRLTTAQRDLIASPPTGLMLYNSTLSCLQINDGTSTSPIWNSISGRNSSSNGSSIVSNFGNSTCDNPSSGAISGTMARGVAVSGVTMTIRANVTQIGSWSLSAVNNGVTFTGSGTFSTTGCQAITLTASGTPTATGTFTWNTNSTPAGGASATVILPSVPNICNSSNPTIIVDVVSPTGKTWMDRNLGANRVAQSSSDAESFGSLYQWGRGSDGHQCVNRYSGDGVTTSSLTNHRATSSTDQPGHGNFIYIVSPAPIDWRSPQNDNLWQGVNGVNNPCPTGYRLPTSTELNNERASWSSFDVAGAFGSVLKLPAGGYRNCSTFWQVGSAGGFWSSTVNSTNATQLFMNSGGYFLLNAVRSEGYSVRCIKN